MAKYKDNNDRRIRTLDELKEYCEYKDDKSIDDSEVYILVGGCCRSSKYIQYYKETGEWWIEHQISDESEEFRDDTAHKRGYPILFEAMEKGCLIKYDWGNNG